jgi:glucose-6-phosphate isomerase
MLAQSQAMMWGRNLEETHTFLIEQGKTELQAEQLAAAMSFEGNRPTNTLLADSLSAESLGALLCAYEHKVFVQAVIWHTNAFDQMGVELGKTLSNKILPHFSASQSSPVSNQTHKSSQKLTSNNKSDDNNSNEHMDDSTRGLLSYLLKR